MPRPTEAVSVRHPNAPGAMETLDPARDYPDDSPFVLAYSWAFVPRDVGTEGEIVESVAVPVVEQATAEPGQKRTRTRSRR